VCSAIVLMKSSGSPRASSAKGATEPKGQPPYFFDAVDNTPFLFRRRSCCAPSAAARRVISWDSSRSSGWVTSASFAVSAIRATTIARTRRRWATAAHRTRDTLSPTGAVRSSCLTQSDPRWSEPEKRCMVSAGMTRRLPSLGSSVLLALLASTCATPSSTTSRTGAPSMTPLQTLSTPPGGAPYSAELEARARSAYEAQGPDYVPRTRHVGEGGKPRFVNRLILETSPYSAAARAQPGGMASPGGRCVRGSEGPRASHTAVVSATPRATGAT
jgi:hypothetical protein